MKAFSMLLAVAVSVAASMTASAAVITTSPTEPVGPFIDSISTANELTSSDPFRTRTNNGGEVRDLGQIFQAGSVDVLMDSFTLRFRAASGSNQFNRNVNITIGEITNDGGSTIFTFTPVSNQTASLPALTANNYVTFDIDDVLLGANKKYGFLVGYQSVANETSEVGFYRNNVASGGDRFFYNYPLLNGNSRGTLAVQREGTRDLQFYVTAVPEPTVFGLLGLSALGLLRRRA